MLISQEPQVWELSRLCPETSTKLYVPELGFWIKKDLNKLCCQGRAIYPDSGGAKSRDRKKCWHFSSSTSLTPSRGTNHSMLLGFSHRLISDLSTPIRFELKIVNALRENIYFLFSEENIHHCYEHRNRIKIYWPNYLVVIVFWQLLILLLLNQNRRGKSKT